MECCGEMHAALMELTPSLLICFQCLCLCFWAQQETHICGLLLRDENFPWRGLQCLEYCVVVFLHVFAWGKLIFLRVDEGCFLSSGFYYFAYRPFCQTYQFLYYLLLNCN